MRTLIAIALACCFGVAGAALDAPREGQPAANPKAKAANKAAQPKLDTASLEKAIRESIKEASHKEDSHADQHLKNEGQIAQDTTKLAVETQSLASYTLWLVVVTGVLAAIALGQLWMFRRQLTDSRTVAESSRDSAEAAKLGVEAVIASERAYVKISHRHPGIKTEHTNTGNDINSIDFEVKNWGKTPCHVTDVRIGEKLLDYGTPLPKPYPFSAARRESFPNGFLVPGEFLERHHTLPRGDIQTPGKQLWLFGYVDYIDTFGQRWRGGYARKFIDRNDGNLVYNTEEIDNFDRLREPGEGNDWPAEQQSEN